MKIGIVIPTRGDRPAFLEFAKQQIKRQTVQPDEIKIIDEAPKSAAPDITYRYRKGCEALKDKVDVILFWEDDDYYRPDYIQQMMNLYTQNRRPKIFGLNQTIYYNIFTRKYAQFTHSGRASMMSTMISTAALNNFSWCADSESFVDLYLWQKLKGASVTVQQPLCIGIKHGIGLCGGGGHVNKWASFNKEDRTYEQLEKWADPNAVNFYLNMTQEILRNKYSKKPFLSIITRVMLDEHGRSRRPSLFSNHTASVANLTSADYEHVLIIDRVGVGMLNANRSFAFAKPEGEFVMLLDDDDFFKRQDFIEQLKNHSGADVIFFKMKILTGDGDQIYPKPASWNSREPKRGQIGGSCFVVRKWVFDKYIRHFAQPSFGDWHFITKVLSDSEVKCVWLDELMCETGRVSRGAAE